MTHSTRIITSSFMALSAVALANPAQSASISFPNNSKAAVEEIIPAELGRNHIEVTVENIKSDQGDVIIDLFDNQAAYNEGSPIGRKIIRVGDDEPVVSFSKLESKYYAYVIFQDTNGNGLLNRDQERHILQGRSFSENRAADWEHAKMLIPNGRVYRTSTFLDPVVEEQISDADESFFEGAERVWTQVFGL